MVRKVRASMGTLGVLGLELVQMDTPPTTAYLQIYTRERCKANCLFCAQARSSRSDLMRIARGMYIPAGLDLVVSRLKMAFERGYLLRACIQTALYEKWWEDTVYLVKRIRKESPIPISLSVFPLSDERYIELKNIGVTELVIPLDACKRELFNEIKGKGAGGPYSWEGHLKGLRRGARIFRTVGTHLIIGLGESEEDAVKIIDELHRSSVNIALFSYTYIPGSQLVMEKYDDETVRHYRNVQVARYLILHGMATYSDMRFKEGSLSDFGVNSDTIQEIIEDGTAFQTSGCHDCNRPMANETFSRIYNFPRKPDDREKEAIKKDLKHFVI